MVDFKKHLERNREVNKHMKWLKENHFENKKEASIITLSDYVHEINDPSVLKDLVKKLSDKLWDKNFDS